MPGKSSTTCEPSLFDPAHKPEVTEAETPESPKLETYRMAPVNPESEIAEAILDAMEGKRHKLLEYLRTRLFQLYQKRLEKQGEALARVTADDARLILESDPNIPGADKLNRNFLGQLFRTPKWEFTGELIKSQTQGSHGNLLRCWRWKESVKP